MKKGDFVMLKNPLPDEIGLILSVVEMRGDRVLVEAQVDMNLKPTTVYLVDDIEVMV